VYIYGYSAPIVYFIGFVSGPSGMYVRPFQAPTLKIFKQIGFELLRILNENVISGVYKLNPGETITKEMQRRAKAFALANNKDGIMKNTLQILNPGYINGVVRPFIATQKATKFGITENYNDTGYIFDDLTLDDFNNFGENYENENENDSEMNSENEMNSEINSEMNSEMNYGINEENAPIAKSMRVYDMDSDQLRQHMINKFGSKFANDYTAEKYINSNGVPAVKYIKRENISSNNENENENNNENDNENYNENNSEMDGPIINGFGEESEEENLF